MHYFCQKNWADYTSKYCLLSIQLTSACIYTPQHINFGCFMCACCLFRIFRLTIMIRGEFLMLSHSEISPSRISSGAICIRYCALVTFI